MSFYLWTWLVYSYTVLLFQISDSHEKLRYNFRLRCVLMGMLLPLSIWHFLILLPVAIAVATPLFFIAFFGRMAWDFLRRLAIWQVLIIIACSLWLYLK